MPVKDFLLNLKWDISLLIHLLEIRRHTCNLYILRLEDSTLTWAALFMESLYKDMEEKKFCSCLLGLTHPEKSILSLTLKPMSSGFHFILKTGWDIQPHEMNNYWTLGPSVYRQPLLN